MSDSLPQLPAPDDSGRPSESPPSQSSPDSAAAGDSHSAHRHREETGRRKKNASRPRSRRRGKPTYPSEQECLAALARLPGLLMLGFLSPTKANAIRAAVTEILRWYKSSRQGGEDRHVDDDSLLAMVRANPDLLPLVETFLTDEQIDLVMGAADEDEPEDD